MQAPTTPNPFFGTRPIKKSPLVNIKDDFNPFKHNKVADAAQVGAFLLPSFWSSIYIFRQRRYGHTPASDTCSCFLLHSISLLNIQLIWLLLYRLLCRHPPMRKIQQPRLQLHVAMFMPILLMVTQHRFVTKFLFLFLSILGHSFLFL